MDSELLTVIAFILRFLLFINHGTPTYNVPIEDDDDSDDFQPLEAVTSILMIRHKILATCFTSEAAPVVDSQGKPETDLDPPEVTTAPPKLHHPLQVAIASNPKSNIESSSSLPDVCDMQNATNFWPSIRCEEWCLIG